MSAVSPIVTDAREQMIEHQVRAWDVFDARVLATLRAVRRERFVPAGQQYLAFADTDVPLPCQQQMLDRGQTADPGDHAKKRIDQAGHGEVAAGSGTGYRKRSRFEWR